MKVTYSTDSWPADEITGRQLIRNILYDNGGIDRFHPETERHYPARHVKAICDAANIFFTAHPELLTDEVLDEMATGERGEVEDKYSLFPEFEALDTALERYFNDPKKH